MNDVSLKTIAICIMLIMFLGLLAGCFFSFLIS
jgi:hypothetical protein